MLNQIQKQMSNNKETAVEWLFHQLWEEPKDKFTWYAILKQAKEQEEKMYFEFFKAGQDSMEEGGKSYDQYYNEKFGGNNE
jgi:hypothetical protein